MYTYAFFKTPEIPLNLPQGILGTLQVVSSERISALVEPGLSVEVLQTSDAQLLKAVLTHDRVIRDLFQQITVLPLRLGTQFVSLESVLAHLQSHETEYLEKLTQFEGKAEYILKLIPLDLPQLAIPPDLKGRDYFLAKKQQYQMQLEQQNQQKAELEQVTMAIAEAYPNAISDAAQDNSYRIYLLVNRQQEPQLHQHLQAWQQQVTYWQINLAEPLPPYHFVSGA